MQLPMEETQETYVRSLGQEDPQRRKWHPTAVFLPRNFHGQRSLAGYNPGVAKSRTWLSTQAYTSHTHTHTHTNTHTHTKSRNWLCFKSILISLFTSLLHIWCMYRCSQSPNSTPIQINFSLRYIPIFRDAKIPWVTFRSARSKC